MLLDNPDLRGKLSDQEHKFTTDYFVAMGRHLKSSVLDQLPPAYQSLVSHIHTTATAASQHVGCFSSCLEGKRLLQTQQQSVCSSECHPKGR